MISKDPAHFCLLAFKKAISCCKAERDVLNHALEKYRPGQSEPILIGGENLLKPALQLMNVFRLRIDEIKGNAVVTSYTRWLESVIVQGPENQEVFLSFSPQFERIWLESKKRLPEHVAKEPGNIGLFRGRGGRSYRLKDGQSRSYDDFEWERCPVGHRTIDVDFLHTIINGRPRFKAEDARLEISDDGEA